MFEVVLKLVDLNAQFLFFISLQVDLFVSALEIFVILRIVLLEDRLVLFKVD